MKKEKSANSLGQQADLVEYSVKYSTCIVTETGEKTMKTNKKVMAEVEAQKEVK